MTTKLLNFKTFLSKAPYQPIGIKPCPNPGDHRHWGRMDCHEIGQKHKKYLKQGIDLHHGMDSFTGQIPEGTVPPNAHDFYDDGHHMATAHGEHTGGGTAGNCKPGTSKKTGNLVPFHRHPGADYCHDINQKHGGSSTNKLIAQNWHKTHQAQLQESWYLFNESQGIEQEQAIPDPYDAGDDHVEELIEEEAEAQDVTEGSVEVESPGSVDNPHNASVNDIITLKVDYIIDHPAKTYKITEIYEEDGLLGATIVHTETGDENAIALSNDNIESVEHWEPEGDPVDSLNPHEFQIGSVLTTLTADGDVAGTYTVNSINPKENTIHYTIDKSMQYPEMDNVEVDNKLDYFNDWVTSNLEHGATVNPPSVPDGFQPLTPGDTINSGNIKNLAVGTIVQQIYADGTGGPTGTITEIEGKFEEDLYRVDWILESGIGQETTHTSEEILDSNWQLSATPLASEVDVEKYLSDDAVANLPKVGSTIDSHELFANVMPGTVLIASNGAIIHIKDNKSDPGSYHGGMLDYTSEGSSTVNQTTWESLIQNPETFTVQSLPDVASYVKNKGFQLGGKVHSDNFASLPVGLSFAYNKGTEGLATATVTQVTDTGIYVDLIEPSGAEYKGTFISEITQLGTKEDTEKGLKIVALPDGTVIQHVAEPTGVTPINKHGLDKGTTVTVKNMAGDVSSAKIIKTHKTKAGQNYTLEYTDGPYEGKTSKVSSQQIKDAETDLEGYQGYGGVVVDEPVYKPGEEPTDDAELTLPPLNSEPGNWDEVLEKTEGSKALGHTAGGTFKHKQTGQEFYIKFPSSGNDEHMKSEALANKLYELVGVSTLGTSLIDFQGKTAVKSTWNPDLKTINISDMSKESGIMDNFVIDAWLANWDVIGPNHDNTQKSGNKIIKVDSGGALGFHGAGSPKGFPDEVVELETMRDPDIGKVAHQVFGNVSEENLIKGAQTLAKVTDDQIDAIVNASKISNKSKMAATLKARRDTLVQKVLSKDLKEGSEWTEGIGKPGQHQHEGYKGWHSETLVHPASNKAASKAHKNLGLEYKEAALGPTSTKEAKFWNRFNNSNLSAETKALAQKALATDFKGEDSAYATKAIIDQFFIDNNIKDTFINAFSSWQGGTAHFPRIKINAALAALTSPDAHTLASRKNEENGYWIQTRKNAKAGGDFSNAWEEGVNEAIALLPYIAASQQGIKKKTTKANPDTLSIVYRGLRGDVAQTYRDAATAEQSSNVKRIHMQGGLQGFSTHKGTSYSFAKGMGSGKGVVFEKKKLPIDDVLLYFPTWEGGFAGESEMAIDPAAIQEFSLDEVKFV